MNNYLSILSTTLTRWQSIAENLPPELLSYQPAPGEWSPLECLAHLIGTERFVFPVRVRAFLAGQDFPAFDPRTQGTKTGSEESMLALVRKFAVLRQESLALLVSLAPGDLARTARHSELGLVSLEQMLNEWAGHDMDHTIQAERALSDEDWRAIEEAFAGNEDPIADLREQDLTQLYTRIVSIAPAPIGLGARWEKAPT